MLLLVLILGMTVNFGQGKVTLNRTTTSINRTPPKEASIHQEIFTNYSTSVKPDGDAENNTVTVAIDVTLLKMSFLDIKAQVIAFKTFTTLHWIDSRLQWDPSDHHNISQITVPNTAVWTPDIVLYNDASNGYTKVKDIYRTNVQIGRRGIMTWTSTIEWKADCEVDVTWFPIDRQECAMVFGSLSYTDDQLVLVVRERPKDIDAFVEKSDRSFVQSGEWQVSDLAISSFFQRFPCCNDEFSSIAYTVSLSRFPQFYFLYIFFPIMSQFFLFLMVFHIRPESGERLGFGITILLNITMFMTFISTKLPEKSNNTPFVGLIFSILFFLFSFALALASVTTFLAARTTAVPRWLHCLAPTIECYRNNKKRKEKRKHSLSSGIYLRENTYAMKPDEEEIEFSTLKEGFDNNNKTSETGEVEFIKNTSSNKRSDCDERSDQVTWAVVMRAIDKYLFGFFLVLCFLVPVLVAVILDKHFLGAWQQIFSA